MTFDTESAVRSAVALPHPGENQYTRFVRGKYRDASITRREWVELLRAHRWTLLQLEPELSGDQALEMLLEVFPGAHVLVDDARYQGDGEQQLTLWRERCDDQRPLDA